MPEESLLVQTTHTGLTEVTLNRPERSNALDELLVEELIRQVAGCYGNGTCLLVLRAAGINFCSGFDRDAASFASSPAVRASRIETLLQLLWDAPFASIACIQGKAIGAGADLLAACDFRLGAPDSSYCFPGFKLFGVSLGNRRLAQITGPKRAFELVLKATVLDVEAAWRCGLVTDIVPSDGFAPHIEALREELACTTQSSIAELRTVTCL